MSEKQPINPKEILIREFKITRGNINCPDYFDVAGIESFSFNVNLDLGFNIEENLIRSAFAVDVATKSREQAEEATGSFHLIFIFSYDSLRDHTSVGEDESVSCNPYLANAIASITYSTSRGILLSRFQGTAMRDFILPVVDPNSLLAKGTSNATE